MIADFVAEFAKLIASNPEDIRVEVKEGDEITEIVWCDKNCYFRL